MSLEQKQIPAGTGAFSADNRTDSTPDYYVTTVGHIWHYEPFMICMIPIYYKHLGAINTKVPLWRMNGAGPNDSKIPVILLYGYFSNRYGMDWKLDGEKTSLARFLANRGRDVWIIELAQASQWSSTEWLDYMVQHECPWTNWYLTLIYTMMPADYYALQAFFDASDICTSQTAIVAVDDKFTSTVDNAIFCDVPAHIAAILHITGQTQVQWVGHSMGGLICLGLMPTQYTTTGKAPAGNLEGHGSVNLPPDSILSLTALCSPTALLDCSAYLLALHASGDLNKAWTYRGKLPVYFNYISRPVPRWPAVLQAPMDTSLMKQLDMAIGYKYFSFFNPTAYAQQYYHSLFEGATLYYAWPEWNQWTVHGHAVTTPVTCMYDGNGFDALCSWRNVSFIPDKLAGYHSYMPFFQFIHDTASHCEMINGYNVEGGDPSWPKDLNWQFGGTYHAIWYDLNRYLPPTPFSAFAPVIVNSGNPLIAWQNLRDAVSFEIWARQGSAAFSRKVSGVNSTTSAIAVPGLSSGVWQIKVRAVSLGGSWRDHSGATSTGEVDNPALYLTITKP